MPLLTRLCASFLRDNSTDPLNLGARGCTKLRLQQPFWVHVLEELLFERDTVENLVAVHPTDADKVASRLDGAAVEIIQDLSSTGSQ